MDGGRSSFIRPLGLDFGTWNLELGGGEALNDIFKIFLLEFLYNFDSLLRLVDIFIIFYYDGKFASDL